MRVLALDYGSKTVGVAVTDPLGLTSQPVETITRSQENKLRRTYARIEELVRDYAASTVVVGLPLNMDGSEGPRAQLAREFGAAVERRCGVPVVFSDERLTTLEADEFLAESGVRRENRKAVIDQLAACLILDSYRERMEQNHG